MVLNARENHPPSYAYYNPPLPLLAASSAVTAGTTLAVTFRRNQCGWWLPRLQLSVAATVGEEGCARIAWKYSVLLWTVSDNCLCISQCHKVKYHAYKNTN